MAKIEIEGIEMTLEAAQFAEETGSKPLSDVARLIDHGVDNAWFLDVCTDGADSDRIDGAHEYYHAIAAEADRRRIESITDPCPGEAHKNAHIDNCGLCLGVAWGRVLKGKVAP